MDPQLIDALRDDLKAAHYTADAVRQLLGDEADEARDRGVFVAAERRLDALGTSPLGSMIRLFLLGHSIDSEHANEAFPALTMMGAVRLGLVVDDSRGFVRATLSLNAVSIADCVASEPLNWWLISDLDDQLRSSPARHDHVMGVGRATRQLISLLPDNPVKQALDLGTGCGIVALHLALRGPAVATDISPRALRFARANAKLNCSQLRHPIEFREGDLFEPVRGDLFDLIASNPPFVISPREADTGHYEYRDAGLVGDELVRRVLTVGGRHLKPDGTLLCLANWESHWGAPGLTRVREWVEAMPGRVSAWVIERDRVTPLQYAETWSRDGGARVGDGEHRALLSRWLDDFTKRKVVGIGLGSIRLRNDTRAVIRLEEAAGRYGERPGTQLDSAFELACQVSDLSDEAMLSLHWLQGTLVTEQREYDPGSEGPRSITLHSVCGVERVVQADPLIAAAVGACDGDLSLQQIADALATILDIDADASAESLVAGFRELVWLGMVQLATPQSSVE